MTSIVYYKKKIGKVWHAIQCIAKNLLATIVASWGKKITQWQVYQLAKKLWHNLLVA